jgi:hypothetical protein
MVLTPELIEHAKKEVQIEQYFQKSETATAKHILFKEFTEGTKWKGLPKIIFYILMDELYGQAKAADGNLGYLVTLKQTTDEQ